MPGRWWRGELADGSLELIDGHLRAETTPDMEVPVLVVDLDETETAKLLAVYDPLGGMAEANEEMLADLISKVETESDAVQALLDEMLKGDGGREAGDEGSEPANLTIPEAFQVVVQCRDEVEQQEVYERLSGEGYDCKLLML